MKTADRLEDKIYRALCWTLSERKDRVEWAGFSAADWERLGRMAKAEGVAPLVSWTFKEQGWPEGMPAGVRASLAEAYYQTAAYNAMLFQELERILAALDEAGIPVIVLKGAALARTIYPDPGLRPMGDLDLLVPAELLEQAVGIAQQLGYTQPIPEAAPGLRKLLNHEIYLKGPREHPAALELHWTLAGTPAFRFSAPVGWFWTQTEPLVIQGQRALGLNPTAHLLYLTIHMMLQHGGGNASLLWRCDIDRLVRAQGERIDWELLTGQAKAAGWSGAVYTGLREAQAAFGTPIPDEITNLLGRRCGAELGLVVQMQARSRTRMQGEWKKLASLRWPARLRLLKALVFPGRAYMLWRYRPSPAAVWPLYYPFRWVDILIDGLRTMGRMSSGERLKESIVDFSLNKPVAPYREGGDPSLRSG